MTVREELINEIDRASDDVLQVLLSFLRQRRLSQSEPSVSIDSAEISSAGLTAQKHYPLRGMPLVIAEDFDAPMEVPQLIDRIAKIMENENVGLNDLLPGLEAEKEAIWQEKQS
ncbi:hypothetical protein [Microcoleus sp. CAWBG58]|uniref:hypothetical protein n=1 Tax=Microcoleus sp. CAWBG58 TaxID=2841651 RepID=UPI0025EDA698|nr:hypothetical protein [Microcoleus sp. CAWBG58]